MPRTPPVGRRFKPGQSGNPNGARAHDQDLKRLRRLSAPEVANIGAMILEKDLKGLQEIVLSAQAKLPGGVDNPAYDPTKHTVLQIWFASIAVKAIQKGDPLALTTILNRIVGAVPKEVRLGGIDGEAIKVAPMDPAAVKAELDKLRGEY